MKVTQRSRLSLCLALTCAAFVPMISYAQLGGADVVSIIVPFPAGGASDVVARTMQPSMAKSLGKTVIVENISGAGGAIGSQKLLSTSVPGQSILAGSPNETILTPLSIKAVKYKAQDFKLVSHLASASVAVFARPNFPANNIEELIKLAKAPGAKPLTHAQSGKGSIFHLASESFASKAGMTLTQVPYRGGGPAMLDVSAGTVDLFFAPVIPQFVQMVGAGRLKVLGIAAAKRSDVLPNAQAFSEIPALKDVYFESWMGIFVPASTSADVAAKIGKAANEAVATPEFQKILTASGNAAGQQFTLDQAAAYYKRETDRYVQLAKDIKLEAE